MTKKLREFLDIIRSEGLRVEHWYHGGRHVLVKVAYGSICRMLTVSQNGSDYRAEKNFRTELRKLKREMQGAS